MEELLCVGEAPRDGDEQLVDEGPAALRDGGELAGELARRVGVVDDRVVRLRLRAACETRGSDRLMSSITVLKTLSGMALSGTRSMTTTHVRHSSSSDAAMRSCSAHVPTQIGMFRSS